MNEAMNNQDNKGSASVKHIKLRRKRRHSVRKRVTIVCAVIVIIALSFSLPLVLTGAAKDALIRVPENATLEMVHDSVSKYLGESYADRVRLSMRAFGFSERHRSKALLITEGMSPLRAGRRLAKGGQSGVTLTINGQRTKTELARYIARNLDITEKEMLDALNDPELLAEYDTDPDKVTSLFLNNSYEFYWNSTAEDVIERMQVEYDKFWNGDRKALAEKLQLSPQEICILSSIVDEETNVADEKGRVGRLYMNRLEKGMRLQADPTVRFALDDFGIKRISLEDTQNPSPYNTYRRKGLPPGAIRTPNPATIDAILHSEPSSDLYMCADTSFNGHHYFSADYDTHRRYAQLYRKALDDRNIHR